MNETVLVGTSGFSYPEWKGSFYPPELPSKKYLSFYAQHFRTTEINNTFYRLPTVKLTEGWAAEVPGNFSFTLKLSQKITHQKRLKNADAEMQAFLTAADGLKQRMGPVLVQLPPYFKQDLEVLSAFLTRYSSLARLAVEFRHASWFTGETYGLLRDSGSALAVVESDGDLPAVREVTGNFIYMRLRKGDYSTAELRDWAKWINAQKIPVYCYLKHDQKAPLLAQKLKDCL